MAELAGLEDVVFPRIALQFGAALPVQATFFPEAYRRAGVYSAQSRGRDFGFASLAGNPAEVEAKCAGQS